MKNVRKIIKEEIDDFDWIRETQPQLKKFNVTYRMSMEIEAYTEEEALEIYESAHLGNVRIDNDTETPGIRYNEWVETIGINEID